MINRIVKYLVIGSVVVVGQGVIAGQIPRVKETKIAGIDFSAGRVTNQQVVQEYGEGCVDDNYPYHYSRIYRFPAKGLYAAFSIVEDDLVSGVTITSKRIGFTKKCIARGDLRSWGTGRGIVVGGAETKVLDVYGSPTTVKDDGKTEKTVTYFWSDEERGLQFVFSKGRVVSITIDY